MEIQHKKWTKSITGRKQLATVKNPLRNYVENEIGSIDLSQYGNRPSQKIDLSIGDPTTSQQFRTHPSNLHIITNHVGKIDGYTNFQGSLQARTILAQTFASPNYKITKQHVFMTSGGSLAIWNSIMLLAQAGDNFLFPSPGFPLGLLIASNLGIIPKFYKLKPDQDWQADLKQMEALIDEKTKFIYVNDPSNPLGTCWTAQHKKQILTLAEKHKLPLIADQIYQGVTYGEPTGTFSDYSNGKVTILKCSGLTKRWFGPGWRLGWLIVYCNSENTDKYISALKGISNITLMPHTVLQSALPDILKNPNNSTHLQSRMKIMQSNQKLLKSKLADEKYCRVMRSQGALYATIMLKLENLQFTSCIQFCKQLYAEQNIMIFPGQFFASSLPFIRLTISCNIQRISNFLQRFCRFCQKYLKVK